MSILFQIPLTFLSFQLAREMSLLGNYETASVYYQGVVQQVTFSKDIHQSKCFPNYHSNSLFHISKS